MCCLNKVPKSFFIFLMAHYCLPQRVYILFWVWHAVIPTDTPGSFIFPCPFSSVQSLSRVRLFATPWTAAHQASLTITNSQSLLKFISIESAMPSNHLSSVIPFSSCYQSFPASGSFQMSQFFTSGGERIGVSTSSSVLPMNTDFL